jgi:protein-S-isoprenylcysteine O-methyltransferase Ste14
LVIGKILPSNQKDFQDMPTLRLILFALLSGGLLLFTLWRRHAHRWYRFLAFESVLALIFLQAEVWFLDPLQPLQIISWVSLVASIYLAVSGVVLLYKRGAPEGDLEETTQLVTTGIYRYLRHPLYASLLYFGFGAALKQINLPSIGLLILVSLAVVGTARVEEQDNIARFGEAYAEYLKETKKFIPFLY